MAHSFNCNMLPATGAIAIFNGLLKTAEGVLKLAGWVRTKDSDGTTYSAAGTQLTTGAAGANGLGNVDAWFVVRNPSSSRWFMFQRKADNATWTVKYSVAGFTGGAPDATTPATAADEVTIISNAAMLPADGGYTFHAIGGDSTVGYGFAWWAVPTGDANGTYAAMLLDVMATGSFPAGEFDPAVVYASTAAFSDIPAGTNIKGFFLDTGVEEWAAAFPFALYSENTARYAAPATTGARGTGADEWSGKDVQLPVPYGRTVSDTHPGWKGFGSLMYAAATYRNNMDTLNVGGGSKNGIFVKGFCLPWDGSDPTI